MRHSGGVYAAFSGALPAKIMGGPGGPRSDKRLSAWDR
jgi:hypothetical protein